MSRPDPAEQSRSRRERILDAAFHAFATRGYRDTAVDDIAGAAETSKGGIYFHFPTKESIFRELMETTADKLVARVERAVAVETEPVARAEVAIAHGARHVRRSSHDGAAAVPRHHGRRARVPDGDERPPRALRAPDPGLPRRGRRGRGASRRSTPGSRASPGSAPSTRSSRAGSWPTTRAGSRTPIRRSGRSCCARSAWARRGSSSSPCPRSPRAPTSRRRPDDGACGPARRQRDLAAPALGARLAALLEAGRRHGRAAARRGDGRP